jgi:hypothetical protein
VNLGSARGKGRRIAGQIIGGVLHRRRLGRTVERFRPGAIECRTETEDRALKVYQNPSSVSGKVVIGRSCPFS